MTGAVNQGLAVATDETQACEGPLVFRQSIDIVMSPPPGGAVSSKSASSQAMSSGQSTSLQRNPYLPAMQMPVCLPSQSDEARDKELLRRQINDYFRAFTLLEQYVSRPRFLAHQPILQCTNETSTTWIIDTYYSLDDSFAREMLGKRNIRSHKELDDVSTSLYTPIASLRRQFDNLKRVQSTVEEQLLSNRKCNIADLIEREYLLSPLLARKYACLMFLLCSRFALATRKRLAKLSSINLEACGAMTLAYLVADWEALRESFS